MVFLTNTELWRDFWYSSEKSFHVAGVTSDFLRIWRSPALLSWSGTLTAFTQCAQMKAARVLPSGKGSLSLPWRSHFHTHIFSKHNVQCQTAVNRDIVAAKFKDTQEGQLSCISYNVRVWKEWKGRRRNKGVATKWATLFMFPACLVVFCRTRASCEDSLWSLSEKWCKTVAEIDACLLRINSTNQQGNVSPFLCSSIQTISERFATAHRVQGEANSGGEKKIVFFFVLHFSLATFYYQRLDKCKNNYW